MKVPVAAATTVKPPTSAEDTEGQRSGRAERSIASYTAGERRGQNRPVGGGTVRVCVSQVNVSSGYGHSHADP